MNHFLNIQVKICTYKELKTEYTGKCWHCIYLFFKDILKTGMTSWATEGDRFPANQRIMSSASPSAAAVQLCYEHLNGSCVKTPYSPGPRLILYTVFIFGAVLTVFGNLLVMISILHFKQLHSPANFLITSLACADFLVGVTVMPFSTVRSVESCWYFGESYCQLHSCFNGSFCYASIYHLCFISLDRYIAVTDPLVYPTKFTVSVSGMCIVFSWLFPIIYTFSLLGTGANAAGLEDLVSALTCVGGCQIAVNQSWVLVNFLLFFIPTLAMIVLYSKISSLLNNRLEKLRVWAISLGDAQKATKTEWPRGRERQQEHWAWQC